jgi:hypothetical protein
VIFARIRGGLGNQMFQFAAGVALSRRLERPVTFDTSWYRRTPPGVTPRHFGLDSFTCNGSAIFDPFSRKLQIVRFLSKAARKLSGRDVSALYVRATDANGLFFEEERLRRARVVELDGYWQAECYFTGVANEIRASFAPANHLSSEGADFARTIDACNAVGVHVRRGDYISSPSVSRRYSSCSLEYYTNAVELVKANVERPEFFVFSDDPPWACTQLKLAGPTVVISGQAGLRDHEELWLMSRCKHFIIANSTFGWWAAWLSTFQDKTVVAPRRWFADDEQASQRILPAAWKAI